MATGSINVSGHQLAADVIRVSGNASGGRVACQQLYNCKCNVITGGTSQYETSSSIASPRAQATDLADLADLDTWIRTMVRSRNFRVVVLICIATTGLSTLYCVHSVYSRREGWNSGQSHSRSDPKSHVQRHSSLLSSSRVSGNVDKSSADCVDYFAFITTLRFDPSTVVTSDGMFRTVKRLLFFIGHPRSGSSLLGRLLDAHPHITISHEVH